GQGANGINVVGAGDTVEGLSITGFQTCFVCPGQVPGAQEGGSGLEVRGSGDIVAGNFLGVAPDGKTAGRNQFAGVNIVSGEPFASTRGGAGTTVGHDTIGGTTPAASTVLSGNSACTAGDCEGSGVYVFSGSGSVIERNYIGTTVSGTSVLTNSAT